MDNHIAKLSGFEIMSHCSSMQEDQVCLSPNLSICFTVRYVLVDTFIL